MNIIAVIPARGGSKGIPRKNLRPLSGKPLIYYTIKTAIESEYIDYVVVTTEDEEIAEVARLYGAEVIKRPPHLSEDDITLDPVVYHAVNEAEKVNGKRYEYVVTIQPTSPLLSPKTLDRALMAIMGRGVDTIISATEERHLYWKKIGSGFIPAYAERKNRQYLEPIYRESGAFVITHREFVKKDGRFGKRVEIFITPEAESVDIDSVQDWWVAENTLKKLRIVIRTDGGGDIGMGHVYRGLTLANRLGLYHDIIFLMREDMEDGVAKVRENNYRVETFQGEDAISPLAELKPQIVINDILDTTEEYVKSLKKLGYFTVNFEDLGPGAELADLVINALYENASPSENHYYGHKYVCLRDEFLFTPPVSGVKKEPKKILITFGGSDPGNLTIKTLRSLERLKLKDISVTVIVGMAYRNDEELITAVNALENVVGAIDIKKNVKHMAREIAESDLVITSNGRTIYEVTSMGVPCISISQNEREMRHLFSYLSGCIVNLGLSYNVKEEEIARAIDDLLRNPDKRAEINRKMLAFNLRGGIDRVINLIMERYHEKGGRK